MYVPSGLGETRGKAEGGIDVSAGFGKDEACRFGFAIPSSLFRHGCSFDAYHALSQ